MRKFLIVSLILIPSLMSANKGLRLAKGQENSVNIALEKVNVGNAYYNKLDFKNALLAYLSALKILEDNKIFKASAEVCLQLGNINFFIMRSDKAISYYHKAISYYQAAGDETSLPIVYDAMGLSMFFLRYGPIDSALIYGNKLLNYSRTFPDRSLEAYALMVVGMYYLDETRSVSRKQKVLTYSDSALNRAVELHNNELISIIYSNFAGFYDRTSPLFELTGNLSFSRHYYDKAYHAAKQAASSYLQARILNYLAAIDIEEGKYDMAENRLELSETKLNEPFQFSENSIPFTLNSQFHKIFQYFLIQLQRTDMYEARFKLAMAKGEFRKAVDYLQFYHRSQDTITASHQGRQLELLMAEDEAYKQDQKIRTLAQANELNNLRLSQSRTRFIVTGTGIALVSIILLLFLQRRKLRAEQQSIATEQRLLRAQMNPHFIFNSLASIQNFVINEESGKASIYLSRFSQLVRNILDNSTEEYVTLEKEISTIENYLVLQKVRYAGKFDYKIAVDETLRTEDLLIPPMLAQPFIENAIEHGIRHKSTSGQIEVRFQQKGGIIRVEVEDNGVGREKALEIESKHNIRHRSMAISITRDRLDLLNKKLKNKIRMNIVDLKDADGQACGTRVEFGIPLVKN